MQKQIRNRISFILAIVLFVINLGGLQIKGAGFSVSPGSFEVTPNQVAYYTLSATNDTGASQKITVELLSNKVGASLGGSYSNLTVDKGGSLSISLVISAPTTVEKTSQDLIINFLDENGNIISTHTLYVNVGSAPAETDNTVKAGNTPVLRMTSPSSATTMNAGYTYTVDAVLKNTTLYTASKIKIYAKPQTGFSFTYKGYETTFSLSANAQKTLPFEIAPDSDLAAGNYTLTFEYSFQNSAGNDLSGTSEILVKVNKEKEVAPKVVLSDFTVNPSEITAGGGFSVTAQIKNGGGTVAENVQVALSDLSTDGITVSNSSSNIYVGQMKVGGAQSVNFTFNTNSKMANGSYPLTFTVKYNNGDTSYEDKFSYYVTIGSTDSDDDTDRAKLEIVNMVSPNATYGVNENIPVSFSLKNSGSKTATNIKITATPQEGVVPKSASAQVIPELAPGEETVLSFAFGATSSAISQNYSVGFNVEYETGKTDSDKKKLADSFMQYVGANVSNPEADKKASGDKDDDTQKSVPKIIVSSYTVDPVIVMAGSNFDLDMEFQNTHSEKTVSNIKVSFKVVSTSTTDKGNVFTPVNASNTFYIDSISPKGKTSHHLTMYTVPDASPKNYIITVTFDYEDEEGKAITQTEEIGVNVDQVSKLEMAEASVPAEVEVGSSYNLYFAVQNTGEVTLKNLKLKIEGEGVEGTGSDQIFGNFASGSYDYYDGNFTVTEAGEGVVRIVATYNDDSGEQHEVTQEYSFTASEPFVDEGMYMEGMGDMAEMEDMGGTDTSGSIFSKPLFWAGCVAVVVVGAATAIILIRRHKNKQDDFDLNE